MWRAWLRIAYALSMKTYLGRQVGFLCFGCARGRGIRRQVEAGTVRGGCIGGITTDGLGVRSSHASGYGLGYAVVKGIFVLTVGGGFEIRRALSLGGLQ